MKSWELFIITLGTIAIVTYPINMKLINLYMGIFLLVLGLILIYRGRKK